VDAGDELMPLQHLDRRAAEADVVACVFREEDFLAGADAFGVRPHRRHDPGAAAGRVACGDDEAAAGLRLLVARLDDDIIVERFERDVYALGLVQNGRNATGAPRR
jgi:hypothetical protein